MGEWSWIVPLLSALLGASVAGVIAHINARIFANEQATREVEREKRAEATRNVGLAYSIVFKAQSAADLIIKVRQNVVTAGQVAARKGWPLWQALEEFSGVERPRIDFDADELAFLAAKKQAPFANDLQDLAESHNLLVALWRDYNQRREGLGAIAHADEIVAIDNKTVSFEAKSPITILKAIRLDDVAKSIHKIAEESERDARMLLGAVCANLQKALDNDPRFAIKIDPPPGL